jgi:hypothetical protein
MLSLFANDPKEAARWLLRELGWLGLILGCPALRVASPLVRLAMRLRGGVAGLSAAPRRSVAYWITSSAVANSVSGMVRPSALAVLRLMTSSNLVGACTGRSAGFSPLRMRST